MNDTPTTWAHDFAATHGLTLRYDNPLPHELSGYKYDGPEGPVVVLDSALPPERQHFALAHEAAHILLGHTEEVEDNEERDANQLASELMLPHEDFSPEAWRTLHELKELFPHVSYEALARRRLFYIPGVLTVVDSGRVRYRLPSDDFAAPPRPTEPEWEIIRKAYDEATDQDVDLEGLRLSATYVATNPEMPRVLLYVEEG